jgi:hypothetical protein
MIILSFGLATLTVAAVLGWTVIHSKATAYRHAYLEEVAGMAFGSSRTARTLPKRTPRKRATPVRNRPVKAGAHGTLALR